MTLQLISAPTLVPVDLADMNAFLRVDFADDDTLISQMIKAARQLAENITKRQLMTATWELILDEFPNSDGEIKLPRPPVQSITSITYIDTDGVSQTLDSADYRLDSDSEPARITPAYGKTWPSTRDVTNAVRIRYVSGYASASDVPEAIKNWIMIRVATMYENREAFVVGQSIGEIGRSFIDGLLDPYVVSLI